MNTKSDSLVFVLCLLVILSLLVSFLVGCSKGDSAVYSSTPTPTPSRGSTATPSAAATGSPLLSPSPFPTGSPFADVRFNDLGAKMDAIFADTFRSVGSWFGQSTYARSIDLREQNDKYIARLYVPQGDNSKVDAKVENGALHITAQNEGTINGKTETERYEQMIALPKPVQADNVKVEKKDDVVVITVPKATVSAPAVAAVTPVPTATASFASGADWADTMLSQMNQMQAHLNQSIQDIFHNDLMAGASTSQLGSAMNLEDLPGKYVVHYYLPGRNLSDVNVKFENGQLHLSAQKQQKTSDDTAAEKTQSTTVARYESMTTLPGPVKESEMKVDRKEGSVVVTLPKA